VADKGGDVTVRGVRPARGEYDEDRIPAQIRKRDHTFVGRVIGEVACERRPVSQPDKAGGVVQDEFEGSVGGRRGDRRRFSAESGKGGCDHL